MVQFTSMSFYGSESSGEVLVGVAMSGGTADRIIAISISLAEIDATG